jgi:hypothetical protein
LLASFACFALLENLQLALLPAQSAFHFGTIVEKLVLKKKGLASSLLELKFN